MASDIHIEVIQIKTNIERQPYVGKEMREGKSFKMKELVPVMHPHQRVDHDHQQTFASMGIPYTCYSSFDWACKLECRLQM